MSHQHPFDAMLDSERATQEPDPIRYRTEAGPQHERNDQDVWSYGPLQTRGGRPMRTVPVIRGGITQNQYGFIIDLLHDKNLFASDRFFDQVNAMDKQEFDEYMHNLINQIRQTTVARAGQLIDTLKALPRKQDLPTSTTQQNKLADAGRLSVDYEDVATDRGVRRTGALHGGTHPLLAGRYALDTSNDDVFTNDITFFHLWVGDRYGWKLFMYKSDEEIELNRALAVRVARRIAEDPLAALALYGHHKSKCGVCGRKLTNDESRARGIGPVCASRWSY